MIFDGRWLQITSLEKCQSSTKRHLQSFDGQWIGIDDFGRSFHSTKGNIYLSMDNEGKEGDDMSCHIIIHVSCHISLVDASR
jgi:hypothetical protein